jgi:hypothetical protein
MAQHRLDETALVSSDTVQSVTNVTADKLLMAESSRLSGCD